MSLATNGFSASHPINALFTHKPSESSRSNPRKHLCFKRGVSGFNTLKSVSMYMPPSLQIACNLV